MRYLTAWAELPADPTANSTLYIHENDTPLSANGYGIAYWSNRLQSLPWHDDPFNSSYVTFFAQPTDLILMRSTDQPDTKVFPTWKAHDGEYVYQRLSDNLNEYLSEYGARLMAQHTTIEGLQTIRKASGALHALPKDRRQFLVDVRQGTAHLRENILFPEYIDHYISYGQEYTITPEDGENGESRMVTIERTWIEWLINNCPDVPIDYHVTDKLGILSPADRILNVDQETGEINPAPSPDADDEALAASPPGRKRRSK